MGHSIGQNSAEKAADVVITPELAEISILQFSRARDIIAAGRRATEERIPAIRALYTHKQRPEIQ
jgi:predicted acylesterase/phospholipase RssA